MGHALRESARVLCDAEGLKRTISLLMTGRMETERPVQASRARLWETIQSTEPSRWTTPKEVVGFRTEIKAVTGLAEETCSRGQLI